MATRTLSLEVPEELVRMLGSPEAAAAKAKEALVLQLLREAEISQGQAAALLGITRWDILDLMAQHDILSGPVTPEEVEEELATVHRLSERGMACGDNQQQ
ncbi:MAG TPA: UPF0175 family protein [Chloroflexota bacterium]|nr:UPF0175 family protein [Chloroflexota bacterium]